MWMARHPVKKMLADLPMRDRAALRAEMMRVDGGIDTVVELECEACGTPLRTRLEAEASFFIPRSSLVNDAFFLAYGGLHWGWSEVKGLPLGVRRQFVETLERQLEFEKSEMERT